VILTDREIQIALSRKQIKIDPLPQAVSYSSTSVDLTLDDSLTLFETGRPSVKKVINLNHPEYNIDDALAEITRTVQIDPDTGYELPAKQLHLGWSAEFISVPIDSRLAARVEERVR
jgi:dCTP deaminase